MFKEITKEIKVKEYYCDFCNAKKRAEDVMFTCYKCRKLMCHKCVEVYDGGYDYDIYFELCRVCVELIADFRKERDQLIYQLNCVNQVVISIMNSKN